MQLVRSSSSVSCVYATRCARCYSIAHKRQRQVGTCDKAVKLRIWRMNMAEDKYIIGVRVKNAKTLVVDAQAAYANAKSLQLIAETELARFRGH